MVDKQVVLAATDLGEPADEAIRQADRWARETSAELKICFVIPERIREESFFPPAYADDAVAQLELERRAAEIVQRRVQQLTGRSDDIDIIIEGGRADLGIIQLSAELRVSLIVVGNRRSTDLDRLLLGSISERVVRYADCSVLVARASPKTNRILVATDLSDVGRPAVASGIEVAARLEARVTILHCIEPTTVEEAACEATPGSSAARLTEERREQVVDELNGWISRSRLHGNVEILDGRAADVILRRARDLDAQLVVVGTRGRTGLARMAFGSVAETVAREATCSVLAVRLQGADQG